MVEPHFSKVHTHTHTTKTIDVKANSTLPITIFTPNIAFVRLFYDGIVLI